MADIIDDIFNAQANQKSNHILDGRGRLLVGETKYFDGQDGPVFVVEFRVQAVEYKGDLVLAPFVPGQPHGVMNPPVPAPTNVVGELVSWKQLPQKHKSAKGNILGYVCDLLCVKKDMLTAETFRSTFEDLKGPKQAAKGFLIDYETYRQETRQGPNKGRLNTYVRFIGIPKTAGNSPQEVAERRAKMG